MDWRRDGANWPNAEWSRFVDARPHRWHVQRAGAGAKVLLLHGAGASTHSWRDVLPLLAESCDAMAVDLPGHGFTRLGARQRSGLPAMASDLAALLAAEDFAPDLIVGHSAGAAVALRLALDAEAPPKAIVDFNPALSDFEGIAGWLFPIMAKLLAANPFTARAFAALATNAGARRLIEGTGSRIGERGLALYARLMKDRAHVDGALAMMAQWSLDGLIADLPRLDCDVRFVIGAKDETVPPGSADAAAARIPRHSSETWDDAGHLAHEEHAARAVDVVLNRL